MAYRSERTAREHLEKIGKTLTRSHVRRRRAVTHARHARGNECSRERVVDDGHKETARRGRRRNVRL